MEDRNALDWFEIPAADLARATRFYQKVLGRELKSDTMGSLKLSIFPYTQPGVGGCVIAGNGYAPGRMAPSSTCRWRPWMRRWSGPLRRAAR